MKKTANAMAKSDGPDGGPSLHAAGVTLSCNEFFEALKDFVCIIWIVRTDEHDL